MKTLNPLNLLKLTVAVALAIPTIATAGTIASDNFESYSTGNNNLQTQNGGTGWAAGWLAPGAVGIADVRDTTANPLAFTPSGGGAANGATRAVQCWNVSGNVPIAGRQLATPLTSTFYVAYLFRYENTNTVTPGSVDGGNNTFSLHLADTAANTTSLNVGVRYSGAAGGNDFMIRNGTGAPLAGDNIGGSVVRSNSYLLVAKLTSAGGVFNQIDLWVNPAYADSASPGASLSAGTLTSITHVFFRGAANQTDDRYLADNLVLGTTWDDVVPPAGPAIPQVSVETKTDGTGVVVPAQTLSAGNSITNYAIARDGGGIFLSNTVAFWSTLNVTGGITGGDIVPFDGGKSAVFTARLAGSANLRATPPTGATNFVDSGTLTVVAGPATTVRVETSPDGTGTVVPAQSVTPAGTLAVYSISRDVAGNFLANIAATWSLQNITSGIVNGDLVPAGDNRSATFTGNLSGTANIRATSGILTPVDSDLITVSRSVTWVGGGANLWDFSTANWTTGSPVAFLDQDDVTFDAGGSQTPPVNLTTTVKPHSVNVTGGAYTLGGAGRISGLTSVTNSGGDVLISASTNDYSGLTVVSFGTLQLGNGSANGTFGAGNILVVTGGTSPVFNRTDAVASPYVVSNTISGPADFTMEFKSGATMLAGPNANSRAKALVLSGATLILSKTGTGVDLGVNTVLGGTNLSVETGGKCILGLQNSGGDHITAAGRYVHIDGTFDANGVNEAFGVLVGSGIVDNTASSNAVLTINQGASGGLGIGNGGEIYSPSILIQNTGTGTLGITKDGTNTLILTSANTYRGDTRIITGGILELGNINAIQNSTLDRQAADTGDLGFGALTSANVGGLKGARGFALDNTTPAAVAMSIGANGQNNTFSGVFGGSGSLTKAGTGTQTLSGTNTYTGATTISAGALLVNGGLAAGPVTVGPSGTLGGVGVIGGTVAVNGILRPGNNGIGKLTVNNTATLSGSTVIEISLTTTTNADQLAATTINLGGTLTVTNVGALRLKSGNTFTLFTGSLGGSITPTLPALWPGLSWNTSSLGSAGTISVTGTATQPSIASVSSSGGNLQMDGSGGLQGATYYLILSTNVAAPLVSWTRIATNTFGVGGGFSQSVAINPAVPQSFFRLEVP